MIMEIEESQDNLVNMDIEEERKSRIERDVRNSTNLKDNVVWEHVVRYKGRLVNIYSLMEEQKKEVDKREERYKGSHKGDFIVTARLKPKFSTNDKRSNTCKILT